MHFPPITNGWPKIDLPGPYLADVIIEARVAARKPGATLLDCPYTLHAPEDRFTRALRTAWQLAFCEYAGGVRKAAGPGEGSGKS